jgi:hypothetical protein
MVLPAQEAHGFDVWRLQLVSYPRNSRHFVAIKMGVSETVRAGLAAGGSYLNRYVTDEQRSRGPIFVATLWAGDGWLFFRVARSTRMTHIRALRSRLENQLTCKCWTNGLGSASGVPTSTLRGRFSSHWRNWLLIFEAGDISSSRPDVIGNRARLSGDGDHRFGGNRCGREC